MGKYIRQFVDAFHFLEEFEPEMKSMRIDYDELLNTYDEISKQHITPNYQSLHKHLFEAAKFNAENFARQQPLAHQCHAAHFNFQRWLETQPIGKFTDFKMTIGNVFYKGENVYSVTKKKVKETILKGQAIDEDLNVHVWLTLDDMTVYDLSIIPTLRAKGIIAPNETFNSEVVMWREGSKSNFVYQPLLVDDNFFFRVDKIRA